jgi:hypothetical protein
VGGNCGLIVLVPITSTVHSCHTLTRHTGEASSRGNSRARTEASCWDYRKSLMWRAQALRDFFKPPAHLAALSPWKTTVPLT